jgi:hypothetical protein
VVDPDTGGYLYALDSYDSVRGASFRRHGSKGVAEYPAVALVPTELSSVRQSLTVRWTAGADVNGQAVVSEDDLFVLYCGDEIDRARREEEGVDDFLQTERILEVATVAQVKATSRKHGVTEDNEWFIPEFPVARQSTCQFLLYRLRKDDEEANDDAEDTVYNLLAESEVLSIRSVSSPTNIHLAPGGKATEMVVNFVTGSSGTPVVQYGLASEKDVTEKVEGKSDTYTADDMCHEPANLTEPGKFQSPGQLHTVTMTDLKPGQEYQYKVGLAGGQGVTWSETFTFTASLAAGDPRPFSYLVYGDQGCPVDGWGKGSEWTAALTTREVTEPAADGMPVRAIHHFGDLSYAQGAAHQWDQWFSMIQPFSTKVPLTVSVGNHEYDHTEGGLGKDPSGVNDAHGFMPVWGNFGRDSGGECGVPTAKRFTMPQSANSNGVFWYSFDFGTVHTTVISSEHDLSPGSPQHAWLEQDLQSVNRTTTPWLVVETHRPLYEGEMYPDQYAVGVAMRYEIEDLLFDYQVDLVLAGHYHSYFRTCDGLYRSQCDNGGPMHVTVGTAGWHLDDLSSMYPGSWIGRLLEGEYGYGRISVMNASTMHFEFVKAGAESDASSGDVLDDFWIVRDRRSRTFLAVGKVNNNVAISREFT